MRGSAESPSRAQRVKIKDLVDAASEHRLGPNQLTILGGVVHADLAPLRTLLGCLESFALDQGLWCWAHDITWGAGCHQPLDADAVARLERARLFHAADAIDKTRAPRRGADLELRRDGARLRWRFVGPIKHGLRDRMTDLGLPAARDFWADESAPAALTWRWSQLLLWGKRQGDGGAFAEDRVGWARLDYPAPTDARRAQLDLIELSAGGQLAFTWWQGVSKHG